MIKANQLMVTSSDKALVRTVQNPFEREQWRYYDKNLDGAMENPFVLVSSELTKRAGKDYAIGPRREQKTQAEPAADSCASDTWLFIGLCALVALMYKSMGPKTTS